MLLATTNATGALFNTSPDHASENGPAMTGSIEFEGTKLGLAAFLRTGKESGKSYLNLRAGNKDGPQWYGKLFPVNQKKSDDEPDYSGYIEIEANGPRLEVSGKKKTMRKDNSLYIGLAISPMQRSNPPAQGNPVEAGKLPI